MLDDQGMTEEWIVRVQGREYGPADIDTLREWKLEGRLLPENEARTAGADLWGTAAAIPGLFESAAAINLRVLPLRYRSLGEMLKETFRIYRRGFWKFFSLALLTGVPFLLFQLTSPSFEIPAGGSTTWNPPRPSVFTLSMFFLFLVLWPVFLAGIQLATADLANGRGARFGELLSRAAGLWLRFAKLSVIVYGSYVFWTAIPLAIILSLVTGEVSFLSLLLALAVLALQVYMTARLWINFLFWQQSAALGGLSGLAALRESKTLARSRRHEPWIVRPLYRGAIIVSIWIVVMVAVSIATQLPFLLFRLQGITTVEEMQTALQNLANARTPDSLLVTSYVASTLINAAIRPLLGISFVLLYLDSKVDLDE
jgi:hypothetical protein